MNQRILKTVLYASCLLVVFIFGKCAGEKKSNEPQATRSSDTIPGEYEQLIDENLQFYQTPPDHDITTKKAGNMIKMFLRSKRHINHRPDPSHAFREDTKWIWFDSAVIKKLYNSMIKNKNDGVRIYLAEYDDRKDPFYLYTTVILTTTKQALLNDAGHKDFIIHVDDTVSFKNEKMLDWTKNLFTQASPPINQGGLCPPPNDSCKSYGALLLEKD